MKFGGNNEFQINALTFIVPNPSNSVLIDKFSWVARSHLRVRYNKYDEPFYYLISKGPYREESFCCTLRGYFFSDYYFS